RFLWGLRVALSAGRCLLLGDRRLAPRLDAGVDLVNEGLEGIAGEPGLLGEVEETLLPFLGLRVDRLRRVELFREDAFGELLGLVGEDIRRVAGLLESALELLLGVDGAPRQLVNLLLRVSPDAELRRLALGDRGRADDALLTSGDGGIDLVDVRLGRFPDLVDLGLQLLEDA